ncbi:hypothetical protein CEXT_755751 [Caerostris extrusa]|uniref:Uncharacterized protein n=1 Tax=Caerostris extrusa TaxID=172846 RepID=A0AAV4TGB7_CAEEX|nr:hypothetical protein CEXT_755751 [Caerostris extrusa]
MTPPALNETLKFRIPDLPDFGIQSRCAVNSGNCALAGISNENGICLIVIMGEGLSLISLSLWLVGDGVPRRLTVRCHNKLFDLPPADGVDNEGVCPATGLSGELSIVSNDTLWMSIAVSVAFRNRVSIVFCLTYIEIQNKGLIFVE